MQSARLIVDPPLAGPVNMGRDEALLDACRDASCPPVLRFYAWNPPTISLGYFQDYAEYEALDGPVAGLDVVRRTTGGGAILHDLEITYSLTIPIDHPLIHRRPNRLYELAHEAVITAVGNGVRMLGCDNSACDASAQRGPFFCFARRHGLDVVVEDGRGPLGISKFAGSAQRRTQTAILQHGSIMLDSRFDQQPTATWSQVAGAALTFDEAAKRLSPAFASALGVKFDVGAFTDDELHVAEGFTQRNAGDAWTIDRKR
ncbi:MAG: lipoate--protein ligase family protein [Phycisphaerales bacterium]|nr:lipoate--protein ligase family protein [Phycisphaerales bacterium]MCB9855692.1 lipoate--protein ligase family protein [Phycisphaerales bacterium]MCB9862587.1 lipoate--protein ligase family protein [Phycisphaerales bacterium]